MEKILHPLANRGSDFSWARLPVDMQYLSPKLSPEETAIRETLRLDTRGTDYYLLGPLFALLANPVILELVAQPEELRILPYYPPPATDWVNTSLTGDHLGPARMSRVPTSWPVGLDYTLTYLTPQSGRLTDGHTSWTVVVSQGASGRLRVTWPEEFNAGDSAITDLPTWEADLQCEFRHHPGNYPYTVVEKALAELRETNHLLLRWGLAAAWHAARGSMERVALVAVALIKQRNVLSNA